MADACPSINSTTKLNEFRKDNTDVKDYLMKSQMKKKIINCRKNAASILRMGAIVAKQIKSNDSIIRNVMAGANNPFAAKIHMQNIMRIVNQN